MNTENQHLTNNVLVENLPSIFFNKKKIEVTM